MGLEQEIVKSLDLCAVSMSDPMMLEKYPDVVASQFTTARIKIEMLGTFLRKLDSGCGCNAKGEMLGTFLGKLDPGCGCHTKGWMDLSIISEGMGKLVVDTLKKQLEVVQMKTFPVVVRRDFRVKSDIDTDKVNYFEREIKETNCMSCVVLLYYYLYWFLFLIQMNKRIDPTYCTQLDVKWLISNLPRSKEFLEFRYLGGAFLSNATHQSLKDSSATDKYMFSELAIDGSTHRKRKTVLIAAYKRALDTAFMDGDFKNADVEFPTCLKAKESYFIYNTITTEVVAYGMSVMGGMASVFESQDPIQKWNDMHTEIKVRSFIGSKLKSVSSTLLEVLSKAPYSVSEKSWKEKGSKACLFDFCSAGLMMDVCRSFQLLAGLVHELSDNNEPGLLGSLHEFLSGLSGDSVERRVIQSFLEAQEVKSHVNLKQNQKMFISKSSASINSGDPSETSVLDFDVKEDPTEVSLWLDQFKSLYPCRHGISSSSNHPCFVLIPSVEPLEFSDSLITLQNALIRMPGSDAYYKASTSLLLLCSLMKNSRMITCGSTSITMIMGKLLSSRGFRDQTSTSEIYKTLPDHTGIRNQENSGFIDIIKAGTIGDLAFDPELKKEFPIGDTNIDTIFTPGMHDIANHFPISFADIQGLSNRQQKALKDLTLSSRSFKKYPSIMWPVWFKNAGKDRVNNSKQFQEVDETASNLEGSFTSRAEDAAKRAEKSRGDTGEILRTTADLFSSIVNFANSNPSALAAVMSEQNHQEVQSGVGAG